MTKNSRRILEKLRIFVYNIYCIIVSARKERRMKGYLSIRETSYKWGISERRVNQYVAQGRIPGAERFGRSWAIPDDAVKPTDPRKQTPPMCAAVSPRSWAMEPTASRRCGRM